MNNTTRRASMNRQLVASLCALVCVSVYLLPCVHAQDARNKLPKRQHKTSNAPFLKPADAVKKMSIPDGFEVSIFASEPDIAEPIGFCFDSRGRIWIAENFNYRTRRNHTGEQVSRIQILEDTDSDGIFDKKKTFTDTLTFTSGLAVGFGGVFVGSPPNLSFIPDANGDDKPDGPPQVLFDGWGIDDRHETLNSFIWGPDGWLYGCHGVFTHSRVGKPGDDDSKRQFIDGGIWRFHPTRKTFEIFARGLSNPWGFDFNDHGQAAATCCVIPHLFHIVQGGVYHKQSRPHVNPYIYDDIKTIRDHTHLSAHGGARFYLADTFPKKYRDRLFMCNIHEHAVLTDVFEPTGSTFIGRHGDDFMPINDLASVGFSVEIGPDGGVYILDWHDTDVCGNAVNFPNSGRVYRIMPKGVKRIERPTIPDLSDAELVQMQMHSNDWYVRHARLQLHMRTVSGELNSALVHRDLNEMFASVKSSAKRLRALWCLQVTNGLNEERLAKLLGHSDEYVRAWAIQFLCDNSQANAFQDAQSVRTAPVSQSVLDQLATMAKTDDSQIVRLYLASATQRLPYSKRWPILSGLMSHADDLRDNNLWRLYWFALEPMVPHQPAQALKLATESRLPVLAEFVVRRMVSSKASVVSINKTPRMKQQPEWQWTIQKVAPGFRVLNVGERGVVHHVSFRNQQAVQTHPLDRQTPSSLFRELTLPAGKKSKLSMRVSHHQHGDWLLKVRVNGNVISQQLVASKTVAKDEWLNVDVDLSKFAGQRIQLQIENFPNNWYNEWAYWNRVAIVSE